MTSRVFDAKSLSEPMLAYCQLDHWVISVKFKSKYDSCNEVENVVCKMATILSQSRGGLIHSGVKPQYFVKWKVNTLAVDDLALPDARASFLSLARSKLRLCSANHMPGYWSNLPCDWPSTAWVYSEQETENGPRAQFSIRMTSYQYMKSHCGDKTILRPAYLHNGISYTGKTTSLYWIGTQVIITAPE